MARSITGLSARREQQLQEAMFVRLANEYERKYRLEVGRSMTKIGRAALKSPSELSKEVQAHAERLAKILRGNYGAAFDIFGSRILDAASKDFNRHLERKFDVPRTDMFDAAQIAWIEENVGLKITEISSTTQEQVLSIVREVQRQAVVDGIGEAATAKLIRDRISEAGGSLAAYRSRAIARTESHAAANAANYEAAKATGIIAKKEWVSSAGERTRSAHRSADGQRVGIDESFTVGGEQLRYPGDPDGSAANVINCRCVTMNIVD